jgi:hypothetical protein
VFRITNNQNLSYFLVASAVVLGIGQIFPLCSLFTAPQKPKNTFIIIKICVEKVFFLNMLTGKMISDFSCRFIQIEIFPEPLPIKGNGHGSSTNKSCCESTKEHSKIGISLFSGRFPFIFGIFLLCVFIEIV